jgi:hypothetical protein
MGRLDVLEKGVLVEFGPVGLPQSKFSKKSNDLTEGSQELQPSVKSKGL